MHPALVAVPIGLFTGTCLADFAYLLFGHQLGWLGMSFWTTLAGVAFSIPAVITGLIDFSGIKDGYVKGIAIKHMVLNSMMVVLFAFTAALLVGSDGNINDSQASLTICLQIAAFTLMGLAGYLGGELVFKHKMAVNEEEEHAVTEASLK